jgi:hypothetical protein
LRIDHFRRRCRGGSLNDAAQALGDVLTHENQVEIQANTAAFTALTPEMKTANDALKKLKDQQDAIAAKIGISGQGVLGRRRRAAAYGKIHVSLPRRDARAQNAEILDKHFRANRKLQRLTQVNLRMVA